MTTGVPADKRAPRRKKNNFFLAWPRRHRLKLSIVIPVYNEERHVLDVLKRVAAVPLDKELVIVNDASRDGTKAVLDKVEADPAQVTAGTTQLHLHVPVNARNLLLGVAFAILGGVIAGAVGGWRAARLRPARALTDIG